MFDPIQLIIQMCTSLLCWWLNLALQVSQGSASTCFRWSVHFRHNFVKGLFRDTPSNFYWNRFILDRQGAKNKLAQFFWDTVYISWKCDFKSKIRLRSIDARLLEEHCCQISHRSDGNDRVVVQGQSRRLFEEVASTRTITRTRSSATAEKQRVSCPHGGG